MKMILHRFPKTLLLVFFTSLMILSSPCFAPRKLTEEQAIQVNKYLRKKWVPVAYKQPLGFETIFNELEPALWPALPESYEWRVKNNEVRLFKHKLAPNHEFDFVTYTTDSLSRFNFLSRWDGVTHHSFAYTRQNSPLSSNDDARTVFPMSEFTFNGKTYMRGHCIDYLDTHGLSEFSKVGSGTKIEFISTLDARNYIPEPRDPTPYWGETMRKDLVGQIRKEKGCYAQYMYYGFTPSKTSDETATAIPEGIYFVRTDANKAPTHSYHVSWTGPIHKGDKSVTLNDLQAGENFFPAPFIHIRYEGELDYSYYELPQDYTPPAGGMSYEDYHKVLKAADHEVNNVTGKIHLINYLLDNKYDPVQIEGWLKRLVKHAIAIHEIGSYGFLNRPAMKTLLKKLNKTVTVDEEERFSAWLYQLLENDKDKAKTRGRETFEDLDPPVIKTPDEVSPIPEVDVSCFTANGATKVVVRQLRAEPRIRLTNLISTRAGRIAEAVNSEFPTPAAKKTLTIEYTLKPDSTQTKSVRSSFTNIGITPKKVETPKATPPTSTSVNSASTSASDSSISLRKKSPLFSPPSEGEEIEKCFNFLEKLSAAQQDEFMKRLKDARRGKGSQTSSFESDESENEDGTEEEGEDEEEEEESE